VKCLLQVLGNGSIMKVRVNLSIDKIRSSYAIFREFINTQERPENQGFNHLIIERNNSEVRMEAAESKNFLNNNIEISTDVSSIIEESNISTIGC